MGTRSNEKTHNVCFGAKVRKIGIPLHTTVLLYKSGVYIARTCFPDENSIAEVPESDQRKSVLDLGRI